MKAQSLWSVFSNDTNFPVLDSDVEVDVAIIGGGITGITTALLLREQGLSVAVFENRKVGGGTTGHSTGNLYVTVDKNLSSVEKKHGKDALQILLQGRRNAFELVQKNIAHFHIDCDFQKVNWTLYATEENAVEKIIRELDSGRELGLTMNYCELTTFPTKKAVTLDGQAKFNPLLYVQGLAKAAVKSGCQIYEDTEICSIEEADCIELRSKNHYTVKAKRLIHATHIPKGIKTVQTLLGPYREYGIACKLKGPENHPEDILWGYHGEDQLYSTRTYNRDGQQFLIVVGQPHKVGQKNNEENFQKLIEFSRKYFKVEAVEYSWGGQHYRPADFIPYIGKEDQDKEVYIATGFSTDGLIYGTMSAILFSELIQGKGSPLSELVKPNRHTPMKSAKEFVKENVNVAFQYLKDFPFQGEKSFEEVQPGEGKIVEKEGQKLAVFRNSQGELNVCSAVCTHMKCIVNWNESERSWDCPCHGSRFEVTGKVLEGPALHDLHKVNAQGGEHG